MFPARRATLLVLVEATRGLHAGLALTVTIVGSAVVYAGSTFVISRDELRVIISAFRREASADSALP